jgi:CubicO group peptidase (beta-lactamase class C family)
MSISILWLYFLVAMFPAASPKGQTAKPKETHAFTSTVDAVTPSLLREYAVPGAALALIQKGRVVWMQGYGFADVASGTRVTAETVFNVGSISKSPTAWAVMQLVDQGKVDLDRPVDSYLKRWHLPASSFDNSQVTVRRVLSHTSGISNHDFHGWDPESPLPPIEDSLSGKTGTGEVRVVAAPGSGFHYSGANYAILQLLIEEVSGQSFQEYVKANVFQPLHMSNSQYGLPPKFHDVMATPYDGLGGAQPILRYNELSAAGLTMTVRDLAAFAAAGLKDRRVDANSGAGLTLGGSRPLWTRPAIRLWLHGSPRTTFWQSRNRTRRVEPRLGEFLSDRALYGRRYRDYDEQFHRKRSDFIPALLLANMGGGPKRCRGVPED